MCTCKENYIGKTKRNIEIRWEEHSDMSNISELSIHLKSNSTLAFTWKVIMTARIIDDVKKNFDTSFIALNRPSLNEQIDSKKLLQFRKGVTC